VPTMISNFFAPLLAVQQLALQQTGSTSAGYPSAPITAFDKGIAKLGDWASEYAPHVVAAIVTFVIGMWVAKLLARSSRSLLVRAHVEDSLAKFLTNLGYFALLALVVIAALGKLGVETTSFVAIIGAAGLAVGFALQGSLGNLAAGVMIMLFRPFKSGDVILAAGYEGVVEEIQVFATVLTTPDNKRIIVPNNTIMAGAITNLTGNETRRVEIVLGIAGSNDIAEVKASLARVLALNQSVLATPAPEVALASIDNGAPKVVARAWCRTTDVWKVQCELNEAVKEWMETERIAMPVPLQLVRQVV
jgi:small conductance mechanosensitive channel